MAVVAAPVLVFIITGFLENSEQGMGNLFLGALIELVVFLVVRHAVGFGLGIVIFLAGVAARLLRK